MERNYNLSCFFILIKDHLGLNIQPQCLVMFKFFRYKMFVILIFTLDLIDYQVQILQV
jgi:hypothetical protein